jgi:hypothetical protein
MLIKKSLSNLSKIISMMLTLIKQVFNILKESLLPKKIFKKEEKYSSKLKLNKREKRSLEK